MRLYTISVDTIKIYFVLYSQQTIPLVNRKEVIVMDGSFPSGEGCTELEGSRVEIVVKEGEEITGHFDPDEIAKGRRVECDPLGSGTYHGARTEVFYGYGPDPSRASCIIVAIPKSDGTCEKRCKLSRIWEADEKRGRLEIYDV